MSWTVAYLPVFVPIDQGLQEDEQKKKLAFRHDQTQIAVGGNKEALSKRITQILKGQILGAEFPRTPIDLRNIDTIWEFYAQAFRFYGPTYKKNVCPLDRNCRSTIYCKNRHETDPIFHITLGPLEEVKEIQVIDFQARDGKSYDEIGKTHLAFRKLFFQTSDWTEIIQRKVKKGCRKHKTPFLCTMHRFSQQERRCGYAHSFETLISRLIIHTPEQAMTEKCDYELADCPFGAACPKSHEEEPVRIGNFWFWDGEEKKED